MSNRYSRWHQKSFYDCRSKCEDVNTAEIVPDEPIISTEGIFMDKYSGSGMHFLDMEVPGADELMIISLLVTFKALSINQLRQFLQMKRISIGKTAIAKILKKMLAESLVEEYVLFKKYIEPESKEKKKVILKLYKTGRNGYYITRQMGIKAYSLRGMYEIRNRYRNQILHLLTDHIWSQIVLRNLQRNGRLKLFSIDEVRFVNGLRPVFIPLTLQLGYETYIFEFVETEGNLETDEILNRFEEYAKVSGRIFTLVLVLQEEAQCSLRYIRQISESVSINIAFTSLSEWYSETTGDICKISKIS
jgi:hypothetical protein